MQNAGGFAAALGSEAPLPGCGELGVPARRAAPRESCCPGATGASARLGAGRTVPTRPRVLPTGRTSVLWASALSHAALCSGWGGEDGRARAKLLSQLCHRSVSQGESESPRTELCPSGVTALPLPFLPPSRLLGAGASPHGAPSAARPCSPPAQTSPTGAQPVARCERDTALHPAGQAEP